MSTYGCYFTEDTSLCQPGSLLGKAIMTSSKKNKLVFVSPLLELPAFRDLDRADKETEKLQTHPTQEDTPSRQQLLANLKGVIEDLLKE